MVTDQILGLCEAGMVLRQRGRLTDRDGNRIKQDFEDLWATSVQHQIDHLNGRMYFDNLSRTKRDMLLKKWKKIKR